MLLLLLLPLMLLLVLLTGAVSVAGDGLSHAWHEHGRCTGLAD
jgi:hypothetical protein